MGKPHLIVEKNNQGYTLSKSYIGPLSEALQKETFSYSDDGNLEMINTVDGQGLLTKKIIFGMEENAIRYLQYAMKMDTVLSGKDRYTIIHYQDSTVSNYGFYDVNSHLYGTIGFLYDSTGRIHEEVWVQHPEKVIIRHWTYDHIEDGNKIRITEKDKDGNVLYDTYLAEDGSESVFTFQVKKDTLCIDRPTIPYFLDVELISGTVTWEWVAGTWDSIGTHTYAFAPHELANVGEHTLMPELATSLINQSIYKMTFLGETVRGFPVTTVSSEPVLYDAEPPVISGDVPAVNQHPFINIHASEPLQKIRVELRMESNPLAHPIIYMPPDTLFPFIHGSVSMPDIEGLIQRESYIISVIGWDRAGNMGGSIDLGTFLFDDESPELTVHSPTSHGYFHLPQITYSLSENVATSILSIMQQKDDRVDSVAISVSNENLGKGLQRMYLDHAYRFLDSTYYSFHMICTDPAGNISSKVNIDSALFDETPPNISIIFPYDSAVINEPSLSFICNEPLSIATMTWKHVVGTKDTVAPYTVSFSRQDLTPGTKIRSTIPTENRLRDGAIYDIEFYAEDLAGNKVDDIVIRDILFDNHPPEINIQTPQSGTYTNNMAVSYSSTEYLSSAILTIERTGGEPDILTPHTVILEESELQDGNHKNTIFSNLPMLSSGTIYRLSLSGEDMGSNRSISNMINRVTFDNIDPTINVAFPTMNSINTRKDFQYTLSEDIEEGYCVLVRTGGEPDTLSPHIIELIDEDLLEGDHSINISNLGINESSRYHLQVAGMDLAGNTSDTLTISNIIYDVTPPHLDIRKPVPGSLNPTMELVFTLSEHIENATITWERTGGTPDPNSPHHVSLDSLESTVGLKRLSTLANQPELVSGSIYDLVFTGHDVAGHELNSNIVRSVEYDFNSPSGKINAPRSSSLGNSDTLQYTLSEELTNGFFLIQDMKTEGVESIILPENFKNAGEHVLTLSDHGMSLESNHDYSIWMRGQDEAGNELISDTITHYTYDGDIQKSSIGFPKPNTSINTVLVNYTHFENLKSGSMVWLDEETMLVEICNLSGNELMKGDKKNHLLSELPDLQDGHTYTVILNGVDLAGNRFTSDSVFHVSYDITRPTLNVENIEPDTYFNSTELLYTLSEEVESVSFSWHSYLDGKEQVIQHTLTKNGCGPGLNRLNDYYIPELIEGQTYAVTIQYNDLAGNKGNTVQLDNLLYDSVNPVLEITFPTHSQFTSKDRIDYKISETIKRIQIVFSGEEIENKEFVVDTLISNQSNSLSGMARKMGIPDYTPFSVEISVWDLAHNKSESAEIHGIVMDKTSPEFTILEPQGHTVSNHFTPKYILSESLAEAELLISAGSKTIEFPLDGDQLKKGTSTIEIDDSDFADNDPITFEITGKDHAENTGRSIRIENFRLDRKKPVLEIEAPRNNELVNSLSIHYSQSENLVESALIVVNSNADTIEVDIPNNKLSSGNHILKDELPELHENIFYDLYMWGLDRAGNMSDTMVVSGWTLDRTNPTIEFLQPKHGSRVPNLDVSYTLSEKLESGLLKIEKSSGAQESGVPFTQPLEGELLLAGHHTLSLESLGFPGENGQDYSITFTGMDPAGNSSNVGRVSGVHLDMDSPIIKVQSPRSHEVLSDIDLFYDINEDLHTGYIQIEIDRDKGNQPHRIELNPSQITAGNHTIRLNDEFRFQENDVITISIHGMDTAGNQSESEMVTSIRFDRVSPVIRVAKPESGSFGKSLSFSLILSERLRELNFDLSRIDGLPDPNSPYSFSATADELTETRITDYTFSESPALIDEVNYRISIHGRDFAGNQSETTIIDNFQVDSKSPQFTITQPVDGEKISREEISYILSDNLEDGSVIYTYESGTLDLRKEYRIPLKGSELLQGPHLGVVLDLTPSLVDGAKYSMKISGSDKAGNPIEGTTVSQILFDAMPPELSWNSPTSESRQSNTIAYYELSEDLTVLKLSAWREDEDPVMVEMPAAKRKSGKGEFLIQDLMSIEEELSYSFQLTGIDQAGNEGHSDQVFDIVIDSTIPEFEITSPNDGDRLQRFLMSYSINEDLDTLEIIVERTGGDVDENSPHTITLPKYLYKKGRFESIDFSQYANVKDGVEYRISFKGKDLAGNEFQNSYLNNIILDTKPPELSVLEPTPFSFNRTVLLEFETYEPLGEGQVEWVWESGNPDPNPHVLNLNTITIIPSKITQVSTESVDLVSGANYLVRVTVMDRAGNSFTEVIEGVSFDIDPPIITGNYPREVDRVNSEDIQFTSNEILKYCTITWMDLLTKESHSFQLEEGDLVSTEITIDKEHSMMQMVNDHSYSITVSAEDRAGNREETIIVESVVYDESPPVFSNIQPTENSFSNTSGVTFSLNEPCASGRVVWLRLSGPDDPASPHIIDFPEELLLEGENDTRVLPERPLVENAVYAMVLSATDQLGNASRQYNTPNITIDKTRPNVGIKSPKETDIIRTNSVTVTTNESLAGGTLIFHNTGGEEDTNSPYQVDVDPDIFIHPNTHGIEILEVPELNSGSIYNIEFTGTDAGGNVSKSSVENIAFDNIVPEISITLPDPGNSARIEFIDFTLSEDLVSATVIWENESDPGVKPILMSIPDDLLKSGEHFNLNIDPGLVFDANTTYAVFIEGEDRAGNVGKSRPITGLKMRPDLR